MDIARIDYWSTSGTSPLHRAGVLSKLAATALVIASVIIARDNRVLAGVFLMVVLTVRSAGLPPLKILAISIFPGLFAVLYALSQAREGWALPVLIILKALTAATAMLLLISTTPYSEVVGFMGRFLPRVVTDGLFMTYRSFFILIGLLDHLLKALRLRGGFRPRHMVANAANMASGLGYLFIRAFEKSQMLYDVMTIRGYSGRLSSVRGKGGRDIYGLPYLVMAGFFLFLAAMVKPGVCSLYVVLAPAGLMIYLIATEVLARWTR